MECIKGLPQNGVFLYNYIVNKQKDFYGVQMKMDFFLNEVSRRVINLQGQPDLFCISWYRRAPVVFCFTTFLLSKYDFNDFKTKYLPNKFRCSCSYSELRLY